eukprot:5139742-Prymnesium_polylepis.1
MGGSLDRVEVLPLQPYTLEGFTQEMSSFDCRKANCFIQEDRERLLGVIETGFGTLDAFNSAARTMLVSRASLLESHAPSERSSAGVLSPIVSQASRSVSRMVGLLSSSTGLSTRSDPTDR